MIPFLLLVPLFVSMLVICILRLGTAQYAKYIALIGSLVTLALLYFISYGTYTITWFNLGGTIFSFSSSITPLNLLLLSVVLLISPMVFFYSFGFMNTLTEQRRFYLEMLGFEMAMITFSIAGDLLTLFVAWEFLSVMSYLLIGFWHKKEKASRSARKAITTVFIGDISLLGAIVILWNLYGTMNLAVILSHLTLVPELYAAAILFVVAILTKSAQFPFQEWLPDAMTGPTPVSAFLHSTTMVKAGIFALVLLYPLFSTTHLLQATLIIGLITVILSTLNAMKETEIKRVIAYSTVQELGLMMVAASLGAVAVCMYFFLIQSFYKALLFFTSGSVMKASDTEDLNAASGLKKNRMLYLTTLIAVLSLAGFIPFSGFFANIGIGSSAFSNIYLYAILSIVGFSTSFFIFRWFFLISKPSKEEKVNIEYGFLPRSMVYTTVLLAILAIAGSVTFFYLPSFLASGSNYLTKFISTKISLNYLDAAIETGLVFAGALVSYLVYRYHRSIHSHFISGLAYNSNAVNAIYSYFAKFIQGFGEGFGALDFYISAFFDDIGKGMFGAGKDLRHLTFGNINLYVVAFSVGLVIIIAFIFLPGII